MSVPALDVEGPVTAEIFVVALTGDGLVLTGPCGAAPWLVEAVDSGHPMALVERIARDNLDDLTLVHSTSWRFERGQVVLSFVAVVPPDVTARFESCPIRQVGLARGTATEAPTSIAWEAVLEHGLRHLAWLLRDDDEVAATLGRPWDDALAEYVPAPFRQLEVHDG